MTETEVIEAVAIALYERVYPKDFRRPGWSSAAQGIKAHYREMARVAVNAYRLAAFA